MNIKLFNFFKTVNPSVLNLGITSNNVAFEAGGNDLIDWYYILLYMPWKFGSYIDPLTQKKVVGSSEYLAHNTKAIIRFLRHPLIDKNVLVMGNFPALSYSPSLGHVGDYFNAFEKILDDKYLKTKEVKGTLRMSREQSAEFLEDFLDIFRVLEDIIRTLYNFITGAIEIIAGAFRWNIDITVNQPNPSSLKELWLNWYHTVEPKASPTTVLSIGLLLSQSELQKTVMEEREYTRNQTKTYPNPNNKNGKKEYSDYDVPNRKGGDYVHFLSLYPLLVRQTDCHNWGQCWVGEPVFYRDALPGHVNHLGYAVWSSQLVQKFVDLEWHKTTGDHALRWEGKVHHIHWEGPDQTQPDIDVDIQPYTEPSPPSSIDWLILLCFIFGQCRF